MLRQTAVAAARGFATKAAEAAAPAAPLRLFGLSGRYATALYVAAAKANSLATVEEELASISTLARTNAKFAEFLSDPSAAKAKAKAVTGLLEQGKYSATTKQFFAVLAENGRLRETAHIAEKFEELMMASRGEVKGVVTSAQPLSPAEFSAVRAAVEKLAKGEKLNLKAQVNPDIIGGLVVDIGDRHIDLSLNTRIRKMEQLLREAV